MKTIAVIPARAGSKRLPRKNRMELEPGLSLVQQAINCAVDSGVINHVIVLSDDSGLKTEGAEFMYEEPEYASDAADISAAVANATERAENSIGRIDFVVTLQPAVVARSAFILQQMLATMKRERTGGAVTAARTVPWVWQVHGTEAENGWYPGAYPRSADAADHLVEINAIQIATRAAVADGFRWNLPLLLCELPHWCAALDIDTAEDMARVRDLWPWAKTRLETWRPLCTRIDTIKAKQC